MVSSISSSNYFNASIAKMSQQLFSLIDLDSDGSVTKTELQSLSDESSSVIDNFISKVDASDDQAITQQEFESALSKLLQEMKSSSTENASTAAPPPPPKDSGEMFSSLDSNSDGSLTVDELTAGGVPDAEKIFSEIDSNGDGMITLAESDAFDQKMKANDSQSMAAGPPPPPPKNSEEMFTSLDSNSDGSLTVDELTAGGVPDAEKIFSEIDSNGDGMITMAESDAFDQKMKANDSQVSSTDDSSSANLSSLQTEFFNKLMEMIAQNQNYLDLATQTDSVVA